MNASAAGVLLVDKPEGPTSHAVVAAARRALGTRRIGHTGTLDPFASGLLLLCVGVATRIAEYLVGLPKTYRAVARIGIATSTADRTGEAVSVADRWRALTTAEIIAAFRDQIGPILQRPPAYSAKKVGGVRAYDRARRGEAVALEPVPVVIHRLDVLDVAPPDVRFEIECSSGTYIRAVARDAGDALGVGAHLTSLRRTRIGRHDVADAVPMDRLDEPAAVRRGWLSAGEAIAHLPSIEVDAEGAAALAHGKPLPAPAEAPAHCPVAIHRAGRLIAIGERDGGWLRPRKVLERD